MMTQRKTPLTIRDAESLGAAMDLLNGSPTTRTLIVVESSSTKIVGTLTDGDIRRWMRREARGGESPNIIDLSRTLVRAVMNSEPIVAGPKDSRFEKVTEAQKRSRDSGREIRLIPIADRNGRVIDVLDLVTGKQRTRLEVLLMAHAKTDNIDGAPAGGTYTPCLSGECRGLNLR